MERNDAANGLGAGLEEFIGAMKAEDARDRKRATRAKILSAIAGCFYLGLFLLTWFAPPDQSPELYRLILASFGLLFLVVAYGSWRKSRELGGIDYAQSTDAFLEGAEKRYRMVNLRDAAFAVFFGGMFLVMGSLSWLTAKERYFPEMERSTAMLIYAGIILVVLVVGGILGVKEWKKRKEPLVRRLREMRAELTRTETEEHPGT